MNHLGDTNKMVDTPRTETYVLNPLPQVVSAEWARQLERELNAANDRIKRLENAGDGLSMWVCPEYKSDPANIALIEWRKAKEAKP